MDSNLPRFAHILALSFPGLVYKISVGMIQFDLRPGEEELMCLFLTRRLWFCRTSVESSSKACSSLFTGV